MQEAVMTDHVYWSAQWKMRGRNGRVLHGNDGKFYRREDAEEYCERRLSEWFNVRAWSVVPAAAPIPANYFDEECARPAPPMVEMHPEWRPHGKPRDWNVGE